MASLWPWLAVAGMGALHGLNPATGWLAAAVCGLRSRDRAQAALRALVPIGVGHAASIALVAGAVALGLTMDRLVLQAAAGALLLVSAFHFRSGAAPRLRLPAGHAGLALWSFIMSTAHGAGLMLVPALIPICLGDASMRQISAAASLLPVLAAVAVHGAAMLAVTGAMAAGACAAQRRCGALNTRQLAMARLVMQRPVRVLQPPRDRPAESAGQGPAIDLCDRQHAPARGAQEHLVGAGEIAGRYRLGANGNGERRAKLDHRPPRDAFEDAALRRADDALVDHEDVGARAESTRSIQGSS